MEKSEFRTEIILDPIKTNQLIPFSITVTNGNVTSMEGGTKFNFCSTGKYKMKLDLRNDQETRLIFNDVPQPIFFTIGEHYGEIVGNASIDVIEPNSVVSLVNCGDDLCDGMVTTVTFIGPL